MRMLLLIVALITGGLLQPQHEGRGAPALKRTIELPGVSGRIDHLAFDPAAGRLFVAALENGSLEMIDLEKGARIKSAPGLKEPQGVAYVPGTNQVVVACGGDGTVRAYDAATLEERAKTDLGDDADNVRPSKDGKSVIVGYGSGALAVLDAGTLRKITEVKLSGHPESFQLEPGTQRAFVNVPGGIIGGGGQVAVVDFAAGSVIATWSLKEAGRNFPMALNAAGKRLYVGCRRPARLLVIDTDSGRVVASPECVGDADDIFLDPKTGSILVVGGDGAIDVFETKDRQTYARSASVKTASGARTGLFLPERRAFVVASPRRGSQPAELREYAFPD